MANKKRFTEIFCAARLTAVSSFAVSLLSILCVDDLNPLRSEGSVNEIWMNSTGTYLVAVTATVGVVALLGDGDNGITVDVPLATVP